MFLQLCTKYINYLNAQQVRWNGTGALKKVSTTEQVYEPTMQQVHDELNQPNVP